MQRCAERAFVLKIILEVLLERSYEMSDLFAQSSSTPQSCGPRSMMRRPNSWHAVTACSVSHISLHEKARMRAMQRSMRTTPA